MLTKNTIHKAGRIDLAVRDYFINNPSETQIPSKNLMPLFVEKGIFKKTSSSLSTVLRELTAADEDLSILEHCHAVKHPINGAWYFTKEKP